MSQCEVKTQSGRQCKYPAFDAAGPWGQTPMCTMHIDFWYESRELETFTGMKIPVKVSASGHRP